MKRLEKPKKKECFAHQNNDAIFCDDCQEAIFYNACHDLMTAWCEQEVREARLIAIMDLFPEINCDTGYVNTYGLSRHLTPRQKMAQKYAIECIAQLKAQQKENV